MIACIKNWPSLHQTRLSALEVMFDYSGSTWENGERINRDSTETAREDYPESDAEILFPSKGDPYTVLCRSKRAAEEQFARDNAELIADDLVTSFHPMPDCYTQKAREAIRLEKFTDCWVPWLIEALDGMPDDVTEDWKDAGREVAHRLWRETRDCPPKTHGYNTHRKLEPFLRSQGFKLLSKVEEQEAGTALAREIIAELREEDKANVSERGADK